MSYSIAYEEYNTDANIESARAISALARTASVATRGPLGGWFVTVAKDSDALALTWADRMNAYANSRATFYVERKDDGKVRLELLNGPAKFRARTSTVDKLASAIDAYANEYFL